MLHSKNLIDADTAHKNSAEALPAADPQPTAEPKPEHARFWPSHAAAKPVEPKHDEHSDESETGRQSSQPQEVAPAREHSASEQQQTSAPEQKTGPYQDHAKRILQAAVDRNEISSEQAASAWKICHQSKIA